MATELPSAILLLKLTWSTCSHCSEKYLWIKALKSGSQTRKIENKTKIGWRIDSYKI